jgi:hypothetical protein
MSPIPSNAEDIIIDCRFYDQNDCLVDTNVSEEVEKD